jgi:hypothetical protein
MTPDSIGGPYLLKRDVHATLHGLADGDEDGDARPEAYLDALRDVQAELRIGGDDVTENDDNDTSGGGE